MNHYDTALQRATEHEEPLYSTTTKDVTKKPSHSQGESETGIIIPEDDAVIWE